MARPIERLPRPAFLPLGRPPAWSAQPAPPPSPSTRSGAAVQPSEAAWPISWRAGAALGPAGQQAVAVARPTSGSCARMAS
jgi:hypothetical protein